LHKDLTSVKAIRVIAVYEVFKGAIVLVAGVGLLTLLHKNIQDFAEDIVFGLHLDPESHYPQLFIETLGKLDATKIKYIFLFTVFYAIVRFAEAYGLWYLRAWAEWFAIISGAAYLPIEIYEIFKKPTVFRFSIFLLNLAIVLYLIYVRREERLKKESGIPSEAEKIAKAKKP
jgi:uncharacterized membrane protein (DUF2068 family)